LGTAPPRFGFLLLSYNQAPFIESAVASALAQRCEAMHVLISDDSSSDETFEIAKAVAAGYSGPHRLQLNRNERRLGLAAHFNRCIRLLDCEWVICAAGDDISRADRAARIMDIVRRHPSLEGVGSGISRIDGHGRPLRPTGDGLASAISRMKGLCGVLGALMPKARPSQRRQLLRHVTGRPHGVPGATAAWRRRLVTDYPAIIEGCAEDYALSFRAMIGGGTFVDRAPLVEYRMHASNLWGVNQLEFTALEQDALRARQREFLIAGLSQNLADLAHATANGWVSQDLAEQVRAVLEIRRLLAHCEHFPDSQTAAATGEYLLKLALFVSGHARSSRIPRNSVTTRTMKLLGELQGWLLR
jgi:glycosyltransferase involved in cell wall biosynthesis